MAREVTILICDEEPNLRELMRLSLETSPAYRSRASDDRDELVAKLGRDWWDVIVLSPLERPIDFCVHPSNE